MKIKANRLQRTSDDTYKLFIFFHMYLGNSLIPLSRKSYHFFKCRVIYLDSFSHHPLPRHAIDIPQDEDEHLVRALGGSYSVKVIIDYFKELLSIKHCWVNYNKGIPNIHAAFFNRKKLPTSSRVAVPEGKPAIKSMVVHSPYPLAPATGKISPFTATLGSFVG